MPIIVSFPAIDRTRAFNYASLMMVCNMAQFCYTFLLNSSQVSVFKFRMPNVTSVTADLYLKVSHEDCLCSVIAIKDCFSHIQLQIARALPLLVFVAQVFVIREHITFTGDYAYFFIRVYWIGSLLIFFGILFIIYQGSPYYAYTTLVLFSVGTLSFCAIAPQILPPD